MGGSRGDSGSESPDLEMDWELESEQISSAETPRPQQPLPQHPAALEDGEIEDSEHEGEQLSKFSFDTKGKDATEHSIFNSDDLIAMEKRAQRFGLDSTDDAPALDKELKQLYHTLNIITEDDVRHARFDTIHVRGTKEMRTNDVFEYFFTHKPLFLEWIDENSCNVVWKDDMSAARSMIFYSKAIKHKDECENMDIGSDEVFTSNIWSDAILASDIHVPIPPGKWRAGAPHPKSEFIFLRFANKSDKKSNESKKLISKKYDASDEIGKVSSSLKSKIDSLNNGVSMEEEKNKNPWGDLCRSWGINDSQEVFVDTNNITSRLAPIVDPNRKSVKDRIGTIPVTERLTLPKENVKSGNISQRLGKRTIEDRSETLEIIDSENEGSSDDEWTSKSKIPRMRMHADDEEQKMAKCKENNVPPMKKIVNSLTVEVKNEDLSEYESESSDNQKPPRSHRTEYKDKKSNVYSRLGNRRVSSDSDDEVPSKNVTKARSSIISKVQPSKHKASIVSTVWSRLAIPKSKDDRSESDDDSEDENNVDLRRTLSQSKKTTKNSSHSDKRDLRDRIRTKKGGRRSPLRIEIENELYSDKM